MIKLSLALVVALAPALAWAADSADRPVRKTEAPAGALAGKANDKSHTRKDRTICKVYTPSGTRIGGRVVCGTRQRFETPAQRRRDWAENMTSSSARTFNGVCLPDHC